LCFKSLNNLMSLGFIVLYCRRERQHAKSCATNCSKPHSNLKKSWMGKTWSGFCVESIFCGSDVTTPRSSFQRLLGNVTTATILKTINMRHSESVTALDCPLNFHVLCV